MTALLTAVAVLGIAGLSGCLITYDLDSVDEPAAPSTNPTLLLVAPVEDEQVGDFLQVQLAVSNFNLVPKWGQANVPGEGHLQVYIDDIPLVPDVPCTGTNEPAGCGPQGVTDPQFRVDVTSLATTSPARHRLRVIPVNNDRTPHATLAPVVAFFVKLPAGQ